MAKDRPFGSIEPLDRVKMKSWMQEPGVLSVRVIEKPNGDNDMQRVGAAVAFFGVKKRFQKAPKNKK